MAIPLLIVIPAAFGGFVTWRALRRRRRIAVVRSVEFPPSVRRGISKDYPNLRSSDQARILEGLRQYLEVCARARLRPVAMPSRAVDSAWHHFILASREYETFCKAAFGRFLHHTPHESVAGRQSANTSLVRCWRIACAIEGIAPERPSHLPLLFALDAEFGLADGFHYAINCRGATRDGRPLGTDSAPINCASDLSSDTGSACSGGGWFSCAGDAATSTSSSGGLFGDGGTSSDGGSSDGGSSGGSSDGGSACGGSGCGGGGH